MEKALRTEKKAFGEVLKKQRTFFATGKTRSLDFRRHQLQKLLATIAENEAEFLAALRSDLGKPTFEGYVGEIGFAYDEIRHTLKHLDDWAKPNRVRTPLLQWFGRSRILSEPKGVVLVMGPWNYPFQLVVAPLVGAIAAGNCAILKPSELAPATSRALAEVLGRAFGEEFVYVAEGGVEVSTSLLAERFDHIFFTGGGTVGKVVMRAASEYLTPVTLELGGKSPAIVDDSTDLETSARRLTWGKFFNAGQTCVAPDYLLITPAIKPKFLAQMKKTVREFFGEDPRLSPDFGRIINERHFRRLRDLLGQGTVVTGGDVVAEERYFGPTILDEISEGDRVMQDEIFGPILPVLTVDSIDEAIAFVNRRAKPLALYIFSNQRSVQEKVLAEVSYGGGCVNDTLVHLSNPNMPFGGVGDSGMGAYHGKFGFDTFSHQKSVVEHSFIFDSSLRYPPYGDKLKWVRKLVHP